VDTSIPFQGPGFILQIICSFILLYILLPTTVLFLLSKQLLWFTVIATLLKPYLDAYQVPLKDCCHFFLGVELILCFIVYGLDSVAADYTADIFTVIVLIYLFYLIIFSHSKVLQMAYCTLCMHATWDAL